MTSGLLATPDAVVESCRSSVRREPMADEVRLELEGMQELLDRLEQMGGHVGRAENNALRLAQPFSSRRSAAEPEKPRPWPPSGR